MINGSISCFLMPPDQDICNITCNKGYVLIGSDTRTCLQDGNWNGTDGLCQLGKDIYLYHRAWAGQRNSPKLYHDGW